MGSPLPCWLTAPVLGDRACRTICPHLLGCELPKDKQEAPTCPVRPWENPTCRRHCSLQHRRLPHSRLTARVEPGPDGQRPGKLKLGSGYPGPPARVKNHRSRPGSGGAAGEEAGFSPYTKSEICQPASTNTQLGAGRGESSQPRSGTGRTRPPARGRPTRLRQRESRLCKLPWILVAWGGFAERHTVYFPKCCYKACDLPSRFKIF